MSAFYDQAERVRRRKAASLMIARLMVFGDGGNPSATLALVQTELGRAYEADIEGRWRDVGLALRRAYRALGYRCGRDPYIAGFEWHTGAHEILITANDPCLPWEAA